MDTILSQGKDVNGALLPWANIKIGNSPYFIWAKGCFVTEIAEILGTTPDIVNAKLMAVNGYASDGQYLDEVIWEKIKEAFPEYSATFVTPYDNAAVLAALTAGHSVLVQVDGGPIGNPGGLHAVRYMGNGICHDPWTGTARPTSDFPDVKAFNVFSKVVAQVVPAEPTVPVIPSEPVAPLTTYKGLDLTNEASVKAAIDTWFEVANGMYVRADEVTKITTGMAQALGIDPTTPIEQIIAAAAALKNRPVTADAAVTLVNVPPHEKNAVVTQVENALVEVKKLLGL